MRRRLDASGVGDAQVRMNVLMFAQDQYFRELLMTMELVSAYSGTVKPPPQPLHSRLLHILPSVVKSCRLVGE